MHEGLEALGAFTRRTHLPGGEHLYQPSSSPVASRRPRNPCVAPKCEQRVPPRRPVTPRGIRHVMYVFWRACLWRTWASSHLCPGAMHLGRGAAGQRYNAPCATRPDTQERRTGDTRSHTQQRGRGHAHDLTHADEQQDTGASSSGLLCTTAFGATGTGR